MMLFCFSGQQQSSNITFQRPAHQFDPHGVREEYDRTHPSTFERRVLFDEMSRVRTITKHELEELLAWLSSPECLADVEERACREAWARAILEERRHQQLLRGGGDNRRAGCCCCSSVWRALAFRFQHGGSVSLAGREARRRAECAAQYLRQNAPLLDVNPGGGFSIVRSADERPGGASEAEEVPPCRGLVFLCDVVCILHSACGCGPPSRETFLSPRPQASIGLTAELWSRLPRVKHPEIFNIKKDWDCPICLADTDHTGSQLVLLPCQHAFHEECLQEWFRTSRTCPLCVQQVVGGGDSLEVPESLPRRDPSGTSRLSPPLVGRRVFSVLGRQGSP